MIKYEYRIKRVYSSPTVSDIFPSRYFWSVYPEDNRVGFSTSGHSYSKIGAYIRIRRLVTKHRNVKRYEKKGTL